MLREAARTSLASAVSPRTEPEREYAFLLYAPILFICLVLCIVLAVWYHGWTETASFLLDVVENEKDKTVQAVMLISIYVVLTVCCLPGGAIVLIVAGFLLKFQVAFCVNLLSELLGLLLSLLVGRTCLAGQLRRWVMQSRYMREAIEVCEQDASGRFLVLFRFLTIPGWVKNYTLAEMEISIIMCVLTSVPAVCFFAAMFAYIGTKSHDVAKDLHEGETPKNAFSAEELLCMAVGLGACALMVYLGKQAYNKRHDALMEHGQ